MTTFVCFESLSELVPEGTMLEGVLTESKNEIVVSEDLEIPQTVGGVFRIAKGSNILKIGYVWKWKEVK